MLQKKLNLVFYKRLKLLFSTVAPEMIWEIAKEHNRFLKNYLRYQKSSKKLGRFDDFWKKIAIYRHN